MTINEYEELYNYRTPPKRELTFKEGDVIVGKSLNVLIITKCNETEYKASGLKYGKLIHNYLICDITQSKSYILIANHTSKEITEEHIHSYELLITDNLKQELANMNVGFSWY